MTFFTPSSRVDLNMMTLSIPSEPPGRGVRSFGDCNAFILPDYIHGCALDCHRGHTTGSIPPQVRHPDSRPLLSLVPGQAVRSGYFTGFFWLIFGSGGVTNGSGVFLPKRGYGPSNRNSAFVSGSLGRQSRETKEVEYDSANSGCSGAFERRRETSTWEERLEIWAAKMEDFQAWKYRGISDRREAEQ